MAGAICDSDDDDDDIVIVKFFTIFQLFVWE